MTDFTGQYFDRYHILESLGQGGMASVYKAYDTRLERDVAVKIIRIDMFVPATLAQVLKRFEREAKSLGKLSHPNIVSIIDYGDHDGIPYLVMEYLPGGTLKDRLQGEPLSWQDSLRLLIPIARALHFSHQQGIVHRDVKPSNILITLSGEPMLSDFGIAKILESEGGTTLTGTGVGVGTPEYMAPEQWVGKTSPQSDIYSLGVALYEMVTGRKPFTADTPAAILLKQANDPLPRPRRFVPDLPDNVERLILKAMAKNPESRFASMQEFLLAMETVLTGSVRKKQPSLSPDWERTIVSPQPVPEAMEIKPPVPQAARVQPSVPEAMEVPPPVPEPVKVQSPVSEAREVKQPVPEAAKVPPMVPEADKVRPPVSKAVEVPPPTGEVPTLFVSAREKAKQVVPVAPMGAGRKVVPIPKPPPLEWLQRTIQKVRPAWIVILVGVLAVAALAIFLGLALKPGSSAPLSSFGYEYFTSNQSGKAEVWYMDPKGQIHQSTHTNGQYESWSPVLSTGGYVYFTSNQSGKAEVWYMDPKGQIHQYSHTNGKYESWSPAPAAGGYLYFTSNQSGKAEVWYMDPKGQIHQYTHTNGQYESWSPVPAADGYVYFTSNQSGKAEVWYMDSKGQTHQYTQTNGKYESWSPAPGAGGYVYFTSNQSGKAEVWYMDPKGQIHQYTHTNGQHESWSPVLATGGYVYFASNQSGKAEVWFMDPKGQIHQYTNTNGDFKSWIKTLQFGPKANLSKEYL